jgi:hypothetical protein
VRSRTWTFIGAIGAAMAVAVVSVVAQQPVAERPPTKDDPLRFSAFAVQLQSGVSGRIEIVIEQWTPEAERQSLIALVSTATDRPHGQDKLLNALQDLEPRKGYIRTPKSLGWDLKYTHQDILPDGTQRIVIATDKPVSFLAAATQARTMDYPFTLVEMRFPKGSNKGEGKLLSQTAISTKDGKLQLGIYGQEPTRLTTITREKRKQNR